MPDANKTAVRAARSKLKEFRKALLAWFAQFHRDLPWRQTRDPYCIWISEIMLQQTRVAAVIPYYERFLKRFPDVGSLADAPDEEVLRLWSGLGYYSRARNLHQAAKQIVALHRRNFPRTRDELLQLAGIGEYTAAAILSIAFAEPLAVLDGNVARVLARLGALHGDLREPVQWRALQEQANELLATDMPGSWNQAMMELGATLCTPKSPQCLICPVRQFCRARKLGIQELLPEKREKRPTISVALAVAVFMDRRGNALLLPPPAPTRSTADDHVPSLVAKLWHFPAVPANGNAANDLKAYLNREFLRPEPRVWKLELLPQVRHTVTYRKILVTAFGVQVERLPNVTGAKHLPLEEILELPISNLTRKVARVAMSHQNGRHKQALRVIDRTNPASLVDGRC